MLLPSERLYVFTADRVNFPYQSRIEDSYTEWYRESSTGIILGDVTQVGGEMYEYEDGVRRSYPISYGVTYLPMQPKSMTEVAELTKFQEIEGEEFLGFFPNRKEAEAVLFARHEKGVSQ
jgi:hypothetical protein